MDNYQIAEQFDLLSKIMDIHGENSFKSKSYAIAAYTIERLPTPLPEMPPEKIFTIKGIGDAIGKKILEIMQNGEMRVLKEYLEKTPVGVLEMLKIKGLGPKKIATIWKEMGIESMGELQYACHENRLLLFKGFGAKTQQNVLEAIEFYQRHRSSFLYAEVEPYAIAWQALMMKEWPDAMIEHTGAFKRQLEIIDLLEWVITIPGPQLEAWFRQKDFHLTTSAEDSITFTGPENIPLKFYLARPSNFGTVVFRTSSGNAFLEEWQKHFSNEDELEHETHHFDKAKLSYIAPVLRDHPRIIERARNNNLPEIIQPADIRGIIHAHSKWSDGVNTLDEMAKAAKEQGFEYLVISDHSKSAFYANGLTEERLREQHREIDALNERLAPFKVFKSIECDILNDGSLDYNDAVLETFDLVIASVHANLKMTEDKAMVRLLRAIENPYTTILGHLTGRLLLTRSGYPVDHQKIIDACVANHVVIEINAHPRRLDIDWRWIDYALDKGALLSIDPDAHSIEGFKDIRYGVLAAQKGGLTSTHNLSSFPLQKFEEFLM